MDLSKPNTAIDVFGLAHIMLLNIKISCQQLKAVRYIKETKLKVLTFFEKAEDLTTT